MDYKKDIKDRGIASHESSSGMVSFGNNLSKKCERIATAIYLITNFLSDTEPMKFRLRTLSIDFVRDASFIKNGSQMLETNVLDALRAKIEETLSLLELAFIAGLVSEMNFTILKREYVALRDTIEVKKALRESRTDSILGDKFFGTPDSALHQKGLTFESADSCLGNKRNPHPSPDLYAPAYPKGHSIGQTSITMSDRNTKGHVPASRTQRSILADFAKSDRALSNEARSEGRTFMNPAPNRATTDVAKESRRARILKLIKDNREVTIKDITTHFPDLSEKTIQRELVLLTETGVLKKLGERRWSRYALV
ncbi:MAG: hypothetical protein A2747_00035 [Candidatus Yonathbacteria bacterium RIFCSPHIGHO2_01_FULL_44_41]|uniref:HTH deoR-type domain-containing protein n=1 Tax=Candidatus Yonathbacteria bacterium RIFCSPHIGHO2_02_FULL_44_14 TaxID=1802724 RepID=A0A1G2S9H7_9BACT|nr:MAG: hypothetical protein A2747_00035 [Candidatus Yonathbacteria bacterium RIFCSPHIGHO2_01_FULL_44_41]OHA81138.1 MAG: hypothetical protein A3B06_00100 [Candidatus Yonathbacteria bacterium RIFCSPLOWO2_01_FULL_43_20]OHA81723.1 MAG: hypothetical protein A3D51_01380 [Candidatus Yonathbacteria bacterium RIFCSPHIGHO2_02_FULL_44_14]